MLRRNWISCLVVVVLTVQGLMKIGNGFLTDVNEVVPLASKLVGSICADADHISTARFGQPWGFQDFDIYAENSHHRPDIIGQPSLANEAGKSGAWSLSENVIFSRVDPDVEGVVLIGKHEISRQNLISQMFLYWHYI